MKIKTNVKASRGTVWPPPPPPPPNHNQTVAKGLKVKTDVKAGATNGDVRVGSGSSLTAARGLKVKTGIKAGPPPGSTGSNGPGAGQ